jgi:hypothetical protein
MRIKNYLLSLFLVFTNCKNQETKVTIYNLNQHNLNYKSKIVYDKEEQLFVVTDSFSKGFPKACYFFDNDNRLKSFLFMLSNEQYRTRYDYDTTGKLILALGNPFLTQYFYPDNDTIDFVSYFYTLKKKYISLRVTRAQDNKRYDVNLFRSNFISNSQCYKIRIPLTDVKNGITFIQNYQVCDSTQNKTEVFTDTIKYKQSDF